MHYLLSSASVYWTSLRPDDPRPQHLDCDTQLDSLAEGEWLCPTCGVTGGLVSVTPANQSSNFHRTVLEAASWRLASELTLRHPDLRVYRSFPHLDNSDVLMVVPEGYGPRRPQGPVIYLNRDQGRIHVLQRSDEVQVEGGPWTWDEYLTEPDDNPPLLERIEYAAGLPQQAESKPSSREALVYSLIARICPLALMRHPFEISNGSVGGLFLSRPDWWDEIALCSPELAAPRPGDLDGDAGFRFWRIERDDFVLTLETSTGVVWGNSASDEVDLLGFDEVAEVNLLDLCSTGDLVLETVLELGRL